ncbi:MAG: hypothetical protein R8G01_04630 [Ilumatobacteraceae bacterium]|nr:hypothetical protein [Ilumatobacteraceae bacterium]
MCIRGADGGTVFRGCWVVMIGTNDAANIAAGAALSAEERILRLLFVFGDEPVLRWSDAVRPEWFVADGIHMGTEGRIWRAAVTSAALAEFFPR